MSYITVAKRFWLSDRAETVLMMYNNMRALGVILSWKRD